MKRILSFVHLHAPLFFAKRNWGEKLETTNTAKGKVALTYDTDDKELTIECEGRKTFLPSTSVFSMEPASIGIEEKVTAPQVAAPKGKIKAQASSPMDHVQNGLGFGKTND